MSEKIVLNHGSGGRAMHDLIGKIIQKKLGNEILDRFDDSALIPNRTQASRLAMTTDSYVVTPLFFEGGDIGRLAVSGTVNDLSCAGATPMALSLAFILEEGLEISVIERVVDSIAMTAQEAGVQIVTGDTKVVERGRGDQIYINTCGLGFVREDLRISTHHARPGDIVMVTGAIGNHEVALMKARGMVPFEVSVRSDVAPLNQTIAKLFAQPEAAHVRVVKDPTRGGLASALIEICDHSRCEIELEEACLPVDPEVDAVCQLLGFDPLYLANEGKFIIIGSAEIESFVQQVFPFARRIGRVVQDNKDHGLLALRTLSGGLRRLGMLETQQLPRIC